nr:EOG090X0A4V [Macrothrix elegans]
MAHTNSASWRVLELYSGLGGMHYAAKLADIDADVVFSLDINTSANEVYRHNFPNTNQQARNIESLTAKEINKLKPNVIMMSPPCQPFTRVGLKQDVKDPRCSSFLHLLEVIPQFETVTHILVENVVGFETSAMRQAFVDTLKSSQFHYREFILTPEIIGIPNSRNRYYLIAKKASDFNFGEENAIMREFPENFINLLKPSRGKVLQSYLEDNLTDEELECYLLTEKTLMKYARILDIRQYSDLSSCCFTKAYSHYAEGTGSVLQHNREESLHERFAQFVETEDIKHLKPLQLRYFTPREVASLMGFPQEFKFPSTISLRTKYKLLGNSLNVFIVANLTRLLVQ